MPRGGARAALLVLLGCGAARAAPIEYTLTLRRDDWRVRVTLRPAEPQPRELVEVLLDVSRHRDVPDPTYGDQVPLAGAQLALTFAGPGPRARVYARPLRDAGAYGAHWSTAGKGLWTLSLAPLAGQGPAVTFQIGVGVPMPPSAQGQAVQASRVVLAPGAQAAAPGLKAEMKELGERWLRLVEAQQPAGKAAQASASASPAAGQPAGPDDAQAELAAMAALAQALAGRVPRARANASAEFDALASGLASALAKAGQLAAQNRAQAVAQLQPLEESSCLRCHVKFRDGVVEDLSAWPEVKPWRH